MSIVDKINIILESKISSEILDSIITEFEDKIKSQFKLGKSMTFEMKTVQDAKKLFSKLSKFNNINVELTDEFVSIKDDTKIK